MKKSNFIILLTFIIFYEIANAQDSWFWQNPWPTGNYLSDVEIFDNGNIIAYGGKTMLKSYDNGLNWTTETFDFSNIHVISVQFLNDSIGWIYGADSLNHLILKTIDGGVSWAIMYIFQNIWLIEFEFFNEDLGWAIGYQDSTNIEYLFKTQDGGNTWSTNQIWPPNYFDITDCHFINPDTGWVCKYGDGFYKTIDGGATWDSLGFDYFNKVYFINADTGWATSYFCWFNCGYSIHKTTDGGITWQDLINGPGIMNKIYFKNENEGWAIGDENVQTTDGGFTWQNITDASPAKSVSMNVSDDGIGVIVGEYGSLICSQDSGRTWNLYSRLVTNYNLNSVHFASENNGWAVGGEWVWEFDIWVPAPVVLRTNNGGDDWTNVGLGGIGSLPYHYVYRDVYFISENVGWVIPEYSSKIFKTIDGGLSWNDVGLNVSQSLNSICFLNPDTGWAAGFDYPFGTINKTIDGGSNWQQISIPTCRSINKIKFINNHGWAVGNYGTVLKSIDYGDSWTNVPIADTTVNHTSLYFDENGNGWITGNAKHDGSLILYKTSDSGISWDSLCFPNMYWVKSIWFTNENEGIVCGNSVWYTTDGGDTWDKQKISATGNDMYFVNENTGWIVGREGEIIKTTTGGITNIDEHILDSPKIATQFELKQNYPNPFNSTTTIEFQIPNSQFATLKIFNILGQEVATLVSEKLTAGSYKIKWNARHCASGIYYYNLNAGNNFVQTRKLILLK